MWVVRLITGGRRFQIQEMGNGQFRIIDHNKLLARYVDLEDIWMRWDCEATGYRRCLGTFKECLDVVGKFVPRSDINHYLSQAPKHYSPIKVGINHEENR